MINDVVLQAFKTSMRKKYLLSEREVIVGQLEICLERLQEKKHDKEIVSQLTNEIKNLNKKLRNVNVRLSIHK